MMQLKYFVDTCDQGSISKASQSLYISKQGLSRSLQSLEEELKVVLLNRTLNGIQLTQEGKITYKYAKEILKCHSSMLQELNQDTSQCLRIASATGFFSCVPNDLLFSFIEKNPGIKYEQYAFTDMELRKVFQEKHIDLALCSGERDDSSFDYTLLFRNRRCLYVNTSHPFARKKIISVSDLKGEVIAVSGEGYFDSPFIVEQCKKAGFGAKTFPCDGMDLLIQFAMSGHGVSLVADGMAGLPEGICKVYFDDDDIFSYDVCILVGKNNKNPAVQAFVAHAKQYCKYLGLRDF